MNQRILQLPPDVANQIAAGEVIERPASVVKELLENSLDAQSTAIQIELSYGGLNQIKISDNGLGIIAEDLPLAVAAHATSKITQLNDLYAIASMGFRGEALASIASVAKVSISSKPAQQEHAMRLAVHGAELSLSACARSNGTTIEVCDLFYNAPVRKRFLKSERLEFQAIETVVKRFALSAPHIALTLSHNNKQIFTLPAALNEQAKRTRMTKILGASFINNALFINVEHSTMGLQGWLSGLGLQRSQNDKLWVYINQRMVKDKLINHAIKQAYDGLLHPGRFPSCLLYLTMNPCEVDVNVHPTKHEVRFQQPRLVHDFFVAQLTKALSQEEYPKQLGDAVCEPRPHFACSAEKRHVFGRNAYDAQEPEQAPDYRSDGLLHHQGITSTPQHNLDYARASSRLHNDYKQQPAPKNVRLEEGTPWTVLNPQYSLLWINKTPHLVDVIALYHAWWQEYYAEQLPLASRPLLVSVRYPLSLQLEHMRPQWQPDLVSLGIHVESLNQELLIRSVPINAPYLDLKQFFADIAALEVYSYSQLWRLFCAAQCINAQQLNAEERLFLTDYFTNQYKENKLKGLAKQFTEEDCRSVLDV